MKCFALAVLFGATQVFGAQYVLVKSAFSVTGGKSSSANYSMKDAAGQSVIGQSRAANRIEQAGFYTCLTRPKVGVSDNPLIPKVFSMAHPWPNPITNSSVTIRYGIPKTSNVSIKVYNLAGSVVQTLVSGEQIPGMYNMLWDGTNKQGEKVAQGIYFVRMSASEFRATKKMILMK
ncbi:MAG: FlgD immunoglobulin-like domain containing protein [bacterium]